MDELIDHRPSSEKLLETRGTRAGKLKAKPIMIYPSSPMERKLITDAAAKVGGRRISVSSFVMDSALKFAKVIMREETSSREKLAPAAMDEPARPVDLHHEMMGAGIAEDESPEARAYRLTEKLRGLLKRELAEYGGAEGFMRWVRSDEDDAA